MLFGHTAWLHRFIKNLLKYNNFTVQQTKIKTKSTNLSTQYGVYSKIDGSANKRAPTNVLHFASRQDELDWWIFRTYLRKTLTLLTDWQRLYSHTTIPRNLKGIKLGSGSGCCGGMKARFVLSVGSAGVREFWFTSIFLTFFGPNV